MSAAECAVMLTTVPADFDAGALGEALVEARLAACVNVLPPMQSIYRWQGQVERSTERLVLIKTTVAKAPELQKRLQELHPYDVPEVVVLAIAGGSESYLDWLRESC